MNTFNKAFTAFIALVWIAAWGGLIYLMWETGRELSESNSYFNFAFDTSVAGSDRVLATVIAGAAIALGVGLVAAQFMPRRSRLQAGRHDDVRAGDERYRELHQRIDELQRQVADRDSGRAVAPGDPVTVREASSGTAQRPRGWSLLGRDRR